jgi:hypothetical protein
MIRKHKFVPYLLLYIAFTILFLSCGNVVPPDGGPKDTTPPTLLSIKPSDSLLNIKPKKITLRFNKYMEIKDLENHLTFSPLIKIKPSVMSYGKRVEISITDTLLTDNTTYKLSLGDALTDNREATPYSNFEYIFSTGNYFDSLYLTGRIINAITGLPDTSMKVLLYDTTISDSLIYFTPPNYVTKTNLSGFFHFDLLPNKYFRLVAVSDEDNNLLYSKFYENFAFLKTSINPAIDSQITEPLYSFIEVPDADSVLVPKETKGGLRSKNSIKNTNNKTSYNVNVDTSNIEKRTFEVNKPLFITLSDSNIQVDYEKIYLSYDADGISAEAVSKISKEDDSLIITTTWQENKVYTLRLIKGWAKDSANVELPPGKYIFRTKSKEDYGNLTINYHDTLVQLPYYTLILAEKDTLYNGKITSKIQLKHLSPGTFTLLVFLDENKDGKYTTGDFEAKRYPEIMLPHEGKITIRAGWDNEIDYKPLNIGISTSGLKKKKDIKGNTTLNNEIEKED